MARAAPKIDDSAASACGRLMALYSRLLVRDVTTQVLFATPLGSRPVVWISWHEGNLLTLAVHQRILRRVGIAFVPPGLSGQVMRGWLEGLGIAPVPLAEDARRGLGLRQMEAAIAGGKDVLIAVDGPRGPRHSSREGRCGSQGQQALRYAPWAPRLRSVFGCRGGTGSSCRCPERAILLRWALHGPSRSLTGVRPGASPDLPRSCTGSAATHASRSALKTS